MLYHSAPKPRNLMEKKTFPNQYGYIPYNQWQLKSLPGLDLSDIIAMANFLYLPLVNSYQIVQFICRVVLYRVSHRDSYDW